MLSRKAHPCLNTPGCGVFGGFGLVFIFLCIRSRHKIFGGLSHTVFISTWGVFKSLICSNIDRIQIELEE